MFTPENYSGKNLYEIIAGRLVWDPTFQPALMQNPRKALRETLSQAGINPTPDILNPLVDELKAFIRANGSHMLLPISEDYLGATLKPDVV